MAVVRVRTSHAHFQASLYCKTAVWYEFLTYKHILAQGGRPIVAFSCRHRADDCDIRCCPGVIQTSW